MTHRDPTTEESTALLRMRGMADRACDMLRMARALTESGRRIDIAGLDSMVGRLCAQTLDLAPEEGRQMRGALIGLREEADALTAALRGQCPVAQPDADPDAETDADPVPPD